MTPPLNRRCVGQATPLGPRRIADAAGPPAACRARKRARCRVTAGSAAYGNPSSWRPTCRRRAGISSDRDVGEESVDEHLRPDRSRRSSPRSMPPISRVPLPSTVTGCASRAGSANSVSFATRRLVPQRLQLPGVDAVSLLLEPLLHQARERQIHVVAAEQDVIANRDALEREIAVVLADQDQAEVGRAAADVAHEHEIAGAQLPPPAIAGAVDPGVAGGLRLLEQGHVREPGDLGRAQRQRARFFVE